LKKEFIVERQGRSFVLYAGLLELAHQQGLKSIRTELVQAPDEANHRVAICTAIVTMENDGREKVFTGIGDAAPGNVAPAMQQCLIRMAETRCKARALRDAVNIGVAAFEELGEADDYDGISGRGNSSYGGKAARGTTAQRVSGSNQYRVPSVPPKLSATRPTVEEASTVPVSGKADTITTNQVNAVRALSRRLGREPDTVAREKYDVAGLNELTQSEAGELIKSLSAQPQARIPAVTA